VTSQIHTPPEGFGKLMSMVKPRMAVAYHYWNHRDIELEIYERVRETYDGPLTMADDLTVLNVTKDHIEVREVTFKGVGYRASRRAGDRYHARLAEGRRARGNESSAHAADRLTWID
jgi:hypothetical protein